MSNVIIGDILPYTQASATNGQTVFGTNWTANSASDVVVYLTPVGDEPDDVTQILPYPSGYSVDFIGAELEVQVTLSVGADLGDIVTITRQTPADRMNLYSNTNFMPSMLNNDFGILTLVDQQAQLVDQKIGPRYNYSATIVDVVDTILPILGANEAWVKNPNNTGFIPYVLPASGIAPADATYVTITDETSTLPNSVNFAGLSPGIVAFTGSDFVSNPILGTAHEIDVVNATGVAGSVTLSFPDNMVIPGTGSVGLPGGTTGQRVITAYGTPFRYNSSLDSLEFYSNGTWSLINDDTDGNILPGLAGNLGYYATDGVTISPLATATNGVLITDGTTGIPSISSTLPNIVQNNITLLGTLAEALNMGTHLINNVVDPVSPQDAATKNYVDSGGGYNETIIFVNANTGSDVNGNGSPSNPYLTISHALNEISDNSNSKPYVIYVMGFFSEASIEIKPYVSIIGYGTHNTSITSGNGEITLNADWDGITAFSTLSNFSIGDNTDINFDSSSFTGSAIDLRLINIECGVSGDMTFKCGSNAGYVYLENCICNNIVTFSDYTFDTFDCGFLGFSWIAPNLTGLKTSTFSGGSIHASSPNPMVQGDSGINSITLQLINGVYIPGDMDIDDASVLYDAISAPQGGFNPTGTTSIQGYTLTPNKIFIRSVTSATYTVVGNDYALFCNRAGSIALTFPEATGSGRQIKIKDVSGAASVNNITATSSGATFDGVSTLTINTNFGSVTAVDSATNVWSIL